MQRLGDFKLPHFFNYPPYFTVSLLLAGSLSHEARQVFLAALVNEGRAEWIDKSHKKCLILWLRIQDWADCILNFVKENGFEDSVMTIEDIRFGIETRGTGNANSPFSMFYRPELILSFSVDKLTYLHVAFPSMLQELAGIDRGVLLRALKLLEQKGKAAIFKGTSADDEGVKFSA
ncbi:hypothetical protein C4D60_Mb03t17330 [Musa balbisiana]|uniref:Vacuolar protein sorting-associated protein 25 n=1 Tax=Musa balbisiana TaxID=52838 RepID=A0A4S8JCB4_MUSBA|nr:hypothetical protein C4D60_Mb03t17330 [Musa balbisiana]